MVGTAVTVTGAMIMILVKGPLIPLPWTRSTNPEGLDVTKVKGPFFVTTFCPLSAVMVAIIDCIIRLGCATAPGKLRSEQLLNFFFPSDHTEEFKAN